MNITDVLSKPEQTSRKRRRTKDEPEQVSLKQEMNAMKPEELGGYDVCILDVVRTLKQSDFC